MCNMISCCRWQTVRLRNFFKSLQVLIILVKIKIFHYIKRFFTPLHCDIYRQLISCFRCSTIKWIRIKLGTVISILFLNMSVHIRYIIFYIYIFYVRIITPLECKLLKHLQYVYKGCYDHHKCIGNLNFIQSVFHKIITELRFP